VFLCSKGYNPYYFLKKTKTKNMNDYKQYFIEHEKLRNRIIDICMLFHQHDPELYPDICIEDIIFVFNNKTIITVSDINHYKDNIYCYIDIEWLDEDNETIIRDISEQRKKREDYYISRRSKK
jgi:predicted class III extradiol MEMO1 family dioxygenase